MAHLYSEIPLLWRSYQPILSIWHLCLFIVIIPVFELHTSGSLRVEDEFNSMLQRGEVRLVQGEESHLFIDVEVMDHFR